MKTNEIWQDVTYYKGYYQISSLGRVRRVGGRILKQYITNGYYRVRLCKKGIIKNFFVHRLVAYEFKLNPKKKPYVNHINGIKTDNRDVNLEWCTASENNHHAVKLGLCDKGEQTYNTGLTNLQVLEICELIDLNKLTYIEIGNMYGVTESVVQLISRGHNWNWLTNRKSLNLPKRQGKRHPHAKKVINCRGEVYETITRAAHAYNIKSSHIGCVCVGRRKHSGKYKDGSKIKWRYL